MLARLRRFLAEELGPVNDRLRSGLFAKVLAWLKDSRQRLQPNGRDAYAINQLHALVKALSNEASE